MISRRKRRNPIRTFLKREKKTFAEQISKILDSKNDLTAREICAELYDMATDGATEKIHPAHERQYITDLTKDFNATLMLRLNEMGIERYLEEKTGVFRYKKIK